MIPIEHLLVVVALFLVLAVSASKLAARSGVPALLLFLLIGMLAGSDGPGRIYFDYPWLAQAVGVLALALILFAGGLDTRWDEIRPVLRPGLTLATVGVSLTALIFGLFISAAFGFTLLEGILIGAIMSSTDAAAVLTLLRARGLHLRGRLKPLLELESGSNDPMAVFLTIGLTQLLLNPGAQPVDLLPLFILQMGIGAAVGVGMGRAMSFIINGLRLEYDGLYPVATLALALLTYGAAAALNGNGFLAVYLAGLLLGNRDFIHRKSLIRFHDGLAWLMQIAMFLTLGLQVYPSRLLPVAGDGLLAAAFLIFVARPVSVLVSLLFSGMPFREKLFVAWVGLRGAAPIVLATFPLLYGVEKAETIFNLVFFIVFTSVLLQGTLIAPAARWLRVDDPSPPLIRSPLAAVMDDGSISADLAEIVLPVNCRVIGRRILDLSLPPGALIVLIGRQGEMVVPNGGTVLEAGDTVLLLARRDVQQQVRSLLTDPQPT